MIKPRRFRHLPECESCLFYTGDLMLRCPIHPQGAKEDCCLDYRRSPQAVHCVEQCPSDERPVELSVELSVEQWLKQAKRHSVADPQAEDEPEA